MNVLAPPIVLLVGHPEARSDSVAEDLLAGGVAVTSVTRLEDARSMLNAAPLIAPRVALVGPSSEPEWLPQVARQLRLMSRSVHLVFLTPSTQAPVLRRLLAFDPLIGSQWTLLDPVDPGTVIAGVRQITESLVHRQAYEATVSRINAQIARFEHPGPRDRTLPLESQFTSLLAFADQAIFAADRFGLITAWNGAAERLFSRGANEMLGNSFEFLLPADRRGEYQSVLRHVRDGLSLTLELQWPRVTVSDDGLLHPEAPSGRQWASVASSSSSSEATDGGLTHLELKLAPIRDLQQTYSGVLGIVSDVSERRRLEEALARRVQELAEADQRKNEFLAMLAHELRAPLAPLRNAAHILTARGQSVDVPIQRTVGVIERQVGHLSRLIDDLLEVARIVQGRVELRTRLVVLREVLEAAVEMSAVEIKGRRQELSLKFPARPVTLEADPTRLIQVFSNLLNNASRYSPEAGHIELAAELDDGEECPVVVRVRDSGQGISPELLPHIFDLFTQGPRSLARSEGGLGIGLTLVKRLVESHGGIVEAYSAGQGLGSEFTVRLPAAKVPPAESPQDEV